MGMNRYIYELTSSTSDHPVSGYNPVINDSLLSVDVWDMAQAHVLMLKVSPSEDEWMAACEYGQGTISSPTICYI